MRKEKKYHFIYKTINLLSGKYYIGMHSTNNLEDDYLGSGTYLRRAINKHGKENFKREILEFCESRTELKTREHVIVTLQEIAKKDCMNLRVGGSGPVRNYGYVVSDETRKKLAENNARYWLGKSRCQSTHDKISKGNTGNVLSSETREKISKALKGKYTGEQAYMFGMTGNKNPFYGKTHTEETKQIIREKRKHQLFTDETRKKLSIARTGYITPQETKDKISKSNKGKSKPESMKRLFGKPVLQYNMDGEFIHEYYSVINASKTLGISDGGIRNNAKGKTKSSGGFTWKFNE